MEEGEKTEVQALWDDLEAFIRRASINSVRTRSYSLFITNLENAQDKLRRHIVEGK